MKKRQKLGLGGEAMFFPNPVNKYRNPSRSFLVIPHYQRLLRYIEPDFVHVLIDGKFVRSGGKELALELEEKGYEWLEE